jgi:hypothetical protein
MPWKMNKTCKAGFARQTVPSSLTLQDGSVTSEKETANTLKKFFPDDSTVQDSEQRIIRAQIPKLGPPYSQTEPNLTKHEVDEVIRNLDKKCPSPDGIDGAIVKRLHKSSPTFRISLFTKCFLLGCFPKEWKRARVIAIPKSHETKLHSVQGYRGISLSIPGKSLEKLVKEVQLLRVRRTNMTTTIRFHSRKVHNRCHKNRQNLLVTAESLDKSAVF